MNIKEPYFENDLNTKKLLPLTAELLKIPPLTDFPVSAKDVANTPSLRTSLSRLSMEPYYKSSSRRNTGTMSSKLSSKLSSYAMLSDVFDYHYIEKYRLEEHESALASDSDTDYDDIVDSNDNHCWLSDSDADSELEDYKVHLLMFKVNSKAQFTRPPRTSFSKVSDYFDNGAASSVDFSMVSTNHHPKFAAPSLKPSMMKVEFLDYPVEDILANYEYQCNNPLAAATLHEQEVSLKVDVPKAKGENVSDLYTGATPRVGNFSDAYDIPGKVFFL